MARVMVSMKIFPSSIDVDLDVLKNEIQRNLPEKSKVYAFEEEPIAFGLVALITHILVPESEAGLIEKVENSLKDIRNISNFQTLMVRRI